jgi:hypothetical protein
MYSSYEEFCLESLKERDHLKDLGIDEENIKMDQMKIEWECVDWIDLTQFWDLFGLL